MATPIKSEYEMPGPCPTCGATRPCGCRAKPERRGWVSAADLPRNLEIPYGTPILRNGTHREASTMSVTHACQWAGEVAFWFGCPTCDRAAPHEETECVKPQHRKLHTMMGKMPEAADFPPNAIACLKSCENWNVRNRIGEQRATFVMGNRHSENDPATAEFVRDFRPTERCAEFTVGPWVMVPPPSHAITIDPKQNALARDVTVDPEAIALKLRPYAPVSYVPMAECIASQAQLAKAMFVAVNLEELKCRAEWRGDDETSVAGDPRRLREAIDVAWKDDPTFKRSREACEKSAERVWAARKVVQR